MVIWKLCNYLHYNCSICVGKQTEDKEVLVGISGLVKENIEVLGGKTSAEGNNLLWDIEVRGRNTF